MAVGECQRHSLWAASLLVVTVGPWWQQQLHQGRWAGFPLLNGFFPVGWPLGAAG